MTRLFRPVLFLLLWLGVALPAHAAVRISFWSHEFGNSFPHAFVSVRGTPDAGGPPVDTTYGFTAKTISPAILFGAVPGRVEPLKLNYMQGSDAQFSVVLTDEQYAQVLALVAAWSEKTGDATYRLNDRNCVHAPSCSRCRRPTRAAAARSIRRARRTSPPCRRSTPRRWRRCRQPPRPARSFR